MKITKRQLRRIIKEEKVKLIREVGPPPDMSDPDWHPNMSQEWERESEAEERRMSEKPNLALRNAIMDTYETVYEDLISQGADPSVAQDRASDAVMVEVEAWLDAVGIPRTYVGLS